MNTIFLIGSLRKNEAKTDTKEKETENTVSSSSGWYITRYLVRPMGLEPIRSSHTPLKRTRLPFRHGRILVNLRKQEGICSFLFLVRDEGLEPTRSPT